MADDNLIDIETLITKYFASEATEAEMATLLHWIEESDENRKRFFELQDIWHALNPSFELNDADSEKAEETILTKSGIKKNKNKWIKGFIRIWSRLAAVIVLPLILLVIYKYAITDKPQESIREISTAYGCSMKTTLPDGSIVWLNANSSLKYPSEFVAEERNVELSGEAYFDVHADKKHPFIVHTSSLDVKATGTEFNVNSYGSGKLSSVTLVDGYVNVDITDSKEIYDMMPGEYLKFQNGNVSVRKDCDTEKYCSWRNGVLLFDDDTLEEICERLEQIYGTKFEILDPKISATRYCMTLRGESINDILHLLELSAPIKCTMESITGTDSIETTQKVTIASL